MNKFILKIFRGLPGKQYWEEFELEQKPFYNVITALLDVQKSPINRSHNKVEPIVWEQGCLEEVCGSCSMLINGRPRQACTALVDQIITSSKSPVITLAPLSKYPLVRDLVVDRDAMFEALKRIRGWIEVDTSYESGFGPKISPKVQEMMYVLSTCMTCGCCTESCPQVNDHSEFIGPAAISQARLFNSNPTGKNQASERLHVLMDKGGVSDCGNAQNCRQVCPKKIPLTESIAVMGREVTKQAMNDLINLPK
ncbi:MAG: succinate dehydrogenase iron-sulfur subunit [Verrucomicrobia bacterium]|nr:succinate dehydrogenase iron-sulfur subunit [Verrucomicrobiota bacterium]